MQLRRNRKSVVYSWFLTYVIILVIPVVASIFTYVISANTIRGEITSTNQFMLRQASGDIDSIIVSIEKAYNAYVANEDVKTLVDAPAGDPAMERPVLNRIFRDSVLANPLEQEIYQSYLYFKRLEFVVNESSKYNFDIAYGALEVQGVTEEEWMEKLASVREKTIWQMGPDRIAICYPIYSRSFIDNSAVFVAELSGEYAAKLRQSIEDLPGAGFVLLTEENAAVLTGSEGVSVPFSYDEIPEGEGIINLKGNGKTNVVMYAPSEYLDMKYAIMIPQNVFFQKANNVLVIIVIQTVLTLLVGLFFAFWFARKNYMPVSSILQTLGGAEEAEGDNEFEFIQQTVIDKINQIEDAEHKVWKNKDIIFRNTVNKLLSGGMNRSSEFETFLNEFGIVLGSELFAVVMVKIEDFSEMFAGEKEEREESLYVVKIALSNVINELGNEQFVTMVSDMDDMILCVVNPDSAESDLKGLADTMQSLIRNYLHVEVSISVSNIHEDFRSIPACYQEAADAMEYRATLGIGNIIAFSEISPSQEGYEFTVEQEMKIINSVKSGDFDRANAVVGEILKDETIRSMPAELCRCLMFDLTSTVMKAINAVEEIAGTHGRIWETISPMDRLLSCRSVFEMREAITETLRKICDYIRRQKVSRSTRLKDDITSFVGENYHRADLNVNMIAEFFGKNPTYLSRYFKEQTNVGLLDYINKVRIGHAKELLVAHPKMSVADVVEQVGFLNSAALIRVFKKYEGITPGQFRELKRNR